MDAQRTNKLILNKAVQLLAQRDHSAYELSQKLTLFFANKIAKSSQQSEQDDDDYKNQLAELESEIKSVINHCTEHNWMNDAQYIEKYIQMRARKGYGKYKITMELKQRGLSNELTRHLLQTADIDWTNLASEQILKKFKPLNVEEFGTQNSKIRQKSMQFLLSRGFSQEEIRAAYLLLI